MKSKSRAIKGPKVHYFKHDLGVVNAKRSRLKIGVSLCMSLTFVAVGSYSAITLKATSLAQRASDIARAEQKPEEKQPKQQETSTRAREDEALAKEIQKKLREMPKGTNWSVSVRDLNSERMANVRADEIMDSASLYKLFLFAPLDRKLETTSSWTSRLSGQQIENCAELMIKVSDNGCAVKIGNYVKWDNIDALNRSHGFTKTKLNSATSQQTTSREVADLLFRLQNSQILSDKARRVFFDGMYRQKLREGIPKGCGPECLVGNKTGELGGIRHDAAIVRHDKAHYVVVIMSEGGTWQNIADVAHSVDQMMLP